MHMTLLGDNFLMSYFYWTLFTKRMHTFMQLVPRRGWSLDSIRELFLNYNFLGSPPQLSFNRSGIRPKNLYFWKLPKWCWWSPLFGNHWSTPEENARSDWRRRESPSRDAWGEILRKRWRLLAALQVHGVGLADAAAVMSYRCDTAQWMAPGFAIYHHHCPDSFRRCQGTRLPVVMIQILIF